MATSPFEHLVSILPQREDEDDSSGSGTGDLQPSSLFDVNREIVALRDIRETEAREFGPVDASTQKDLLDKPKEMQEGMEAVNGPQAHPKLADQAYFSGISEIRNNPLSDFNTEFELKYKEQQLQYENKKQLQKNLERVNEKKFTPTPRPY